MKVGYTPMETYQMFRSLRREVFNFFDYRHPITFGVRAPETGIFDPGALAHCDFSAEPDKPSLWGEPVMPHATAIRFNSEYLPHLYEDEMLIILLHELCHATAGWCDGDGHGPKWQRMARQVGTIPDPLFVPRRWKILYPKGHPNYWYASNAQGPTIDVWAGSL